MDIAVGLVEAYLYANGYFTVTEYPVLELVPGVGHRLVTDVDILALRLPGAGRVHVKPDAADTADEPMLYAPDPRLVDDEARKHIDFIIGEVKEGRADLNQGGLRQDTLIAALRRFAFVPPKTAARVATELMRRGRARIADLDVRVRLVAFGTRPPTVERPDYTVVLLRDCFAFIEQVSRTHGELGNVAQHKNPALGMLALLAKSGFLRDRPRDEHDPDDNG